MAKRVEGLTEKLLESAKREFLKNGYQGASLRTIAQNVNTTTRSIYVRYKDKEELFSALVTPVLEEWKNCTLSEQENFHQRPKEEQDTLFEDVSFTAYYDDMVKSFVDYIYDNIDVFKLLVLSSEGSSFSTFIDEFVEIDVAYTMKFIEATGNDALRLGRASPELLHILSSAHLSGIFEAIKHDMTREVAYIYINQLREFFECGWKNIFYPAQYESRR